MCGFGTSLLISGFNKCRCLPVLLIGTYLACNCSVLAPDAHVRLRHPAVFWRKEGFMATQALLRKRQALNGKVRRTQEGSHLRAVLFFFAAVEAVHTLMYVWIGVSGMLPMSVPWLPSLMITDEVNLLAIVMNAIITFGLLDAASGLKK
jgi:hypothetical protein